MESESKSEFHKFIGMMESFVSGEHTSVGFVRQMDAEFWASGLNNDDRFFDLQLALDMYGVPEKDFGSNEKALASACRYALTMLRNRKQS